MAAGSGPRSIWARVGLVLGPVLFVAILLGPRPDGLEVAGWRTAALAAWMATWWILEPVPLPATALLPLLLGPMLGLGDIGGMAAPYANPIILLFLGGFILAIGIERWRVHERVAFLTATIVGTGPGAIVAGFMLATAFLSMWISNTAAVLIMLPMGRAIVELSWEGDLAPDDRERLGTGLMLGTAYAATVGGLGTLIGTPPNAFLAAYLDETHGIELGFGQWMLLGIPLVVVGLPLVWFLLVGVLHRVEASDLPGGRDLVQSRLRALGRPGPGEWRVLAIFVLTATLWIVRPLVETRVGFPVHDAMIALLAAILLFVVPSGAGRPLVVWDEALRLPWGVLVLFGGGLSLADTMARTGFATWLGGHFTALGWPLLILVAALTLAVIFLTEVTSNTATAAALIPVAGAVAIAQGADPRVLAIPVALAASCAFMLPVATPPNAVAYASGAVTGRDMARAGFWLNLVFVALVTVASVYWAPFVLGF